MVSLEMGSSRRESLGGSRDPRSPDRHVAESLVGDGACPAFGFKNCSLSALGSPVRQPVTSGRALCWDWCISGR